MTEAMEAQTEALTDAVQAGESGDGLADLAMMGIELDLPEDASMLDEDDPEYDDLDADEFDDDDGYDDYGDDGDDYDYGDDDGYGDGDGGAEGYAEGGFAM